MKTPAYAVLIAILNLFLQGGYPVLVVSGFLLIDTNWGKAARHTAIKKRSQVQKCWLKDKY